MAIPHIHRLYVLFLEPRKRPPISSASSGDDSSSGGSGSSGYCGCHCTAEVEAFRDWGTPYAHVDRLLKGPQRGVMPCVLKGDGRRCRWCSHQYSVGWAWELQRAVKQRQVLQICEQQCRLPHQPQLRFQVLRARPRWRQLRPRELQLLSRVAQPRGHTVHFNLG